MPTTISLSSTARGSARVALREREQLAHERGTPHGRTLDLVGVLAGSPIGHVIGEQLGGREDRREQVVEVVRDAARELPDGFEAL